MNPKRHCAIKNVPPRGSRYHFSRVSGAFPSARPPHLGHASIPDTNIDSHKTRLRSAHYYLYSSSLGLLTLLTHPLCRHDPQCLEPSRSATSSFSNLPRPVHTALLIGRAVLLSRAYSIHSRKDQQFRGPGVPERCGGGGGDGDNKPGFLRCPSLKPNKAKADEVLDITVRPFCPATPMLLLSYLRLMFLGSLAISPGRLSKTSSGTRLVKISKRETLPSLARWYLLRNL